MSLQVKHLPQQYRTVYNPVEVVLYESQQVIRNYPGFAYLIDIKDGSTTLGRLKVPTTTNGYGRFDLSGIMKSYLSSNLSPLTNSITSVYSNTDSFKNFTLEFGWVHYNTGSPTYDIPQTVTFPDSTTDDSYDLTVFNSSLPKYRRDVVNFYDWQYNNYYKKYTENSGTRKFLTNAPNGGEELSLYNQKVMLNDEGFIYALYDNANDLIDQVSISEYNSTGYIISTTILNLTGISASKHLAFPSSPASLNKVSASMIHSGSQPIISTSAASYHINLLSSGSLSSERFYFNINTECRFETKRIEFLNSLL